MRKQRHGPYTHAQTLYHTHMHMRIHTGILITTEININDADDGDDDHDCNFAPYILQFDLSEKN